MHWKSSAMVIWTTILSFKHIALVKSVVKRPPNAVRNGPFSLSQIGMTINLGSQYVVRCAVYTRVSTDAGLDQDFNSLDAQFEGATAYIKSQAHSGWKQLRKRYDDGGFSGGSTDRPALQQLLTDIRQGLVDVIRRDGEKPMPQDDITKALRDRAWSSLNPVTAPAAGMTLTELQQFCVGNFQLTESQKRQLMITFNIRERA
jgi:hypothetical protein